VRLAAAEVGLQLHHRVAVVARDAPQRTGEQPAQALGQVGAAEELLGLAVLVCALAQMHLSQVGRELGRLVVPARPPRRGAA